MRYDCPIKFRAWDGRKMVPVQTLCWNQGGLMWYGPGNQFGRAWINPDYDGWNEHDPKPDPRDVQPVMRFVGHSDINGVEIYEGDIVSLCGGEEVLVIDYCEEYARFGGLICLQDGEEVENDSYRWFDDYGMPSKIEVIGNIYANQDLLKS